MHKNKFSRILITGATGVAGPAIVEKLIKRGYHVKIFSRHCLKHNEMPKQVDRFQGNILDPTAITLAMKNIDAVFHLAAKLHDTKHLTREETYWQTNTTATRLLVNAARAAGVKRFIFFSTINVYGTSNRNHCFDESSPTSPNGIYSRSKLAAEKIVLDAGQHTPRFSVVILRVAAVYGERMKGNYNLLIRYLKKGGFVLLGSGENRRTLIFDKDLATASLMALEHPDATGKIYNITDGAVHTFQDIVHAMCRALDRPSSFIKIPASFMHKLIELKQQHIRSRTLNLFLNAAEKQMESLAVSGEKCQRELNFTPKYDLNKGWRHVISGNGKITPYP
ncbi:UDP-glucose 4-epimerase [Desulfocicer vacuolatum DSM 3385]|uniref:UDP-glucose 4-epimerase n=1 Tax=Desulfocicer vacuolatum DSM 3385 TaxID=1121400 RepID=A0A1W2B7D0_9BACT|nr:NAD-dependent epimerase/dehydratase family protein [Desulfocicer vacuolatum]SMC68754.1 UDP-glucose 4-epimerase [Desulfocicer vacuolatum DSM 3385]